MAEEKSVATTSDSDSEEERKSRFEKLNGYTFASDFSETDDHAADDNIPEAESKQTRGSDSETDSETDGYAADDNIPGAESKHPTRGRFELLQAPWEFEELDSADKKVEQTLRKSSVSSLCRTEMMKLVNEMHHLRKEVLKLQDKIFCDEKKSTAGRKIGDKSLTLRLRL